MSDRLIALHDIDGAQAAHVGGKGAGLGALMRHGFDVPDGFVLTDAAFDVAMHHAGIDSSVVARMLVTHPASYPNIRSASARLRERVVAAGMPTEISEEIRRALEPFGSTSLVARSSALDEDSSGHSFAGMNESFTNLSTIEEVEDAIVKCWASAFGQRSLAYRAIQGIDTPPRMAVVVQVMIDSQRAGVMFTNDPASGTSQDIVIEGALGQGEVVVGGDVEPDTFTIARTPDGSAPDHIVSVNLGRKQFMITRGSDGSGVRTDLSGDARLVRSLSDAEALALAGIGLRIEAAFGTPQDIEWSIDHDDHIWIVQSRPITTRDAVSTDTVDDGAAEGSPAVIKGLPAAPGIVTGHVRVVHSLEEAQALIAGEILVADMTTPDWIMVVDRAAAIVTDRGGVTSHAAIVSRELGVPAVVGTRTASTTLHTGDIVTVDGGAGTIERVDSSPHLTLVPPLRGSDAGDRNVVAPLRTKVMVNLSHPAHAANAAAMDGVDGVGLLRAEFLLTQALGGVHPRTLIENGRSAEFVDVLTSSIEAIARPFGDRPVVYRTADFRSNEFRLLTGGDLYEPKEENPMIGYRGCFRYVHDPAMFELELEAIDRARQVAPGLTLMLPFVRTLWELERCVSIVTDIIDPHAKRLPVWIMAEVPSVLYRMDDYRKLGISGISIGSNDLTQLMLGVDRDSELCAELFDEQDAAVVAAIADIITRAKAAGMTASLCGQAPSNHPSFAGDLVRMGIDSVSVDPSAVDAVRNNLALAEATLEQKEKR